MIAQTPSSKTRDPTIGLVPFTSRAPDFKRFLPFKRFRRRAARAIVDRIPVSRQLSHPNATEKLLRRTKEKCCKPLTKSSLYESTLWERFRDAWIGNTLPKVRIFLGAGRMFDLLI
jgi:hypothetical protein